MGSQHDFDAMSEACIEAARLVQMHGSAPLQTAMRMVLFILGHELAEQVRESQENGRPANPADPFARINSKRTN